MMQTVARKLRQNARGARRGVAERRSAVSFPSLPGIGVRRRSFTFSYATGTELHKSVADGRWAYEPDVLATVLTCLASTPGSTFINVGANIGYFPIVAKGVLGDSVTCIAYEPAPSLAAAIRRGARLNNVEIDVRVRAAADRAGTATFYLSARSDASNSLNPSFRRHRGELEVELTTLDADLGVDATPNSPRPILLIDTETTEPDVLEGGRQFVEAHRPGIVCEVLAGRTEAQLQKFFDSVGYACYALTERGPEMRPTIEGDSTYAHRDWLFWPNEDTPPLDQIAETTARLVEYGTRRARGSSLVDPRRIVAQVAQSVRARTP